MKAYAQKNQPVFDMIQSISIKFRAMKHIRWFVMYNEMLKTTMFGIPT